jgi:Domain of unknown function (DUF3332)
MQKTIQGGIIMKKMRKSFIVISLVLSLFAVSNVGCFGKFVLTKKVYNFNKEVSSSHFVQSIVMWILYIIPVYGIAICLDAVILNLIETWTGSNPMATLEDGNIVVENGESRAVISKADGIIHVDYYESDQYIGSSEIVTDVQGQVVAQTDLGEAGLFNTNYNGSVMTFDGQLAGEKLDKIVTTEEALLQLDDSNLPLPSAL